MTERARRNQLDRDELARRLADACLLDGDFTLRSGTHSATYFDKYRFEGDPQLLAGVARALAKMVPDEIDVLAGLELGGIPVATALSLATGLPAAFVRKQAKPYGTARLAEGHDIEGKHVLVVEDVVSSGGQLLRSSADLRTCGAIVEHAICVVDRGGADALAADGIKLHSLYAITELHAARPPRDGRQPSAARPGPGAPPPVEPVEPVAPRRRDETHRSPGPEAGSTSTGSTSTGSTSQPAPGPSPSPGSTARPVADPDPTSTPRLPKRQSHSRPDRKVAPPLMPRRSSSTDASDQPSDQPSDHRSDRGSGQS